MTIRRHNQFLKHYAKRIVPDKKLRRRFDERVSLFLTNSKHPLLQDHHLTGQLHNYRAFSITADVRVVYCILQDGEILFFDVGTHNQIY